MKALKGLLIYIGIVLAMILGVAIVLFGCMYFFPSFRIMGIGVVHSTNKSSESVVDLNDYSAYNSIEINVSTKRVNVIIDSIDEGSTIDYVFDKDVFGIAFDITEYSVLKNVEVEDGKLKVNLIVTEPDGLFSKTHSSLKVTLPKAKTYSMLLSSTIGDINIGTTSMPNISNLTVSTTTGKLNVSKANSDGKTNTVTINSLNLSTTKGTFDFREINELKVNNTIKIEADNGTFAFDKVKASLNLTGKGIKLDANEITTNYNGFKFISQNGFFDIEKLNTPIGAENTIVTENCDVKISEVSGKTGIITTYGNITIGTLNDYATLQSEHGNVSITKAKGDLRISTEFGHISVGSYERNGRFISVRGNINVKSTGDYIQGAYTQIENTEGSITVDNKINRLLVTTYGSSKVEITFREIKGGLENPLDVFQHKVNIHSNGSALVYMPTMNYKTPFKFIAKGNIDGEISGLVPEYGGDKVKSSDDFQYFPKLSYKDECQKSCYFEFYGTITFQGYLNA